MSNSREIMERKVLVAVSFGILSDSITYTINAIDGFNTATSKLTICDQQQSFTPPHKKNRRGKFKRSGKQ